MRRLLGLAAAALVLAACSGTTNTGSTGSAGTPSPAASLPPSMQAGPDTVIPGVVDAVSPSIVLIETSAGLGSGVVYDGSGDIVTNAHVTGTATQFKVTASNGKQYQARLLGAYAGSDIAVIKVDTPGLKPAHWGNSSSLRVGDAVLAMGNPLGFQSSVTDGIVSGLGRTVSEPGGAVLTNMIQTSAAINPGNSGGGLVDLQSEVIGIPTLAAVDQQMGGAAPGIGFALPSNSVTDYANQIITNGKVINTHRAYLGVQVGDTQGDAGAVVLGVVAGGPAARAGVQVGDIITAVNGKEVTSASSLSEQLANLEPGSTATLTVSRGGQTVSIKVTLGTLPA